MTKKNRATVLNQAQYLKDQAAQKVAEEEGMVHISKYSAETQSLLHRYTHTEELYSNMLESNNTARAGAIQKSLIRQHKRLRQMGINPDTVKY